MSEVKLQGISGIDHVLSFIGFGKFQILLLTVLGISILPQTFAVLLVYFVQHNPKWQCSFNSTICTLPKKFAASDINYKQRCSIPRKEWEYSKSDAYSIVTEFDLYCETEVYSYMATSFFFLSWAIGAVVLGWFADRYGRIKVLIPSQVAIIVLGFICAFSPNIAVYSCVRVIIGFFIPGVIVQLYILSSEFVGTRYRPMAGNCVWLFFTMALVMLGVKAYFIRQWKVLMIICTAPYVILLVFFRFIPESIRWLRLNGQTEKALSILKEMAIKNKREIPDDVKLAPPDDKNMLNNASLLDLFKTKRMAFKTLIQGYAWMVNGMVYYGITLASDDLGGSMYRDYILASLIELPAYLSAMYLCNRIGRKKTVTIPMFIASVACILVSFIPANSGQTHWTVLRVVCGMIGKFCISLSFAAIYTWSVELYPTVIRAKGMGFLQITARVGSALAPWTSKWLKVFHVVLPFLVMGGSSLIASILLQWLPETANKAMPETLDSDEDDQVIRLNVMSPEEDGKLLKHQEEETGHL